MRDQPRRTTRVLLIALMTSAIAVACSSDATDPIDNNNNNDPPEENVIHLRASTFDPALDSVAVDTRIEWRNTAGGAHTLTSDDNEWTHQAVPADAGWTFSHTFDEAGVYDYECQLHAGMTGRIVVE